MKNLFTVWVVFGFTLIFGCNLRSQKEQVSSASYVTNSKLYTPSEKGQSQMKRVVLHARNNHSGASRGYCFEYVWKYLYQSGGYGNISKHWDLPRMGSKYARHFADYMNASQSNLEEAGLVRLDNKKPAIMNPHDKRIPDGAVIVVGPGSYGTRHKEAGDIVIKDGKYFINDGPNMNYGTESSWYGTLLGVYVPK